MFNLAKFPVWICALLLTAGGVSADENDVAVAIVYDTSGSMNDVPKTKSGPKEPKFQIANRALAAIVARLESYAAGGGRKSQAGLFTFRGAGAEEKVPLGPFDAAAMRRAITALGRPAGGTPLGGAIDDATKALVKCKAGSRHVLIITDGENTILPAPETIVSKIQDEALKGGPVVFFHFVAFDVDARAFAAVKKLGTTLVSAVDEKQLNEKITFILEEKILLEKE